MIQRLRYTSLALMIALTGCTTTRELSVEPAPAPLTTWLADHPNTTIGVVTSADTLPWLRNAAVVGDSLVGFAGTDHPPNRRAVALADITSLQTGKFSAGRTLGLVGIGVAVITAAALVVMSGEDAVY